MRGVGYARVYCTINCSNFTVLYERCKIEMTKGHHHETFKLFTELIAINQTLQFLIFISSLK